MEHAGENGVQLTMIDANGDQAAATSNHFFCKSVTSKESHRMHALIYNSNIRERLRDF